MRAFLLPLALLALLPLAGCGSHQRSTEDIARAWSAALDRSDDESAARLFATRALIVQSGELVLTTQADAVRWNASLPCGGTITSVTAQSKDEVLVVFTLKERPRHTCDAPGSQAAALFKVRGGEIVLWHQTTVPGSDAPGPTI